MSSDDPLPSGRPHCLDLSGDPARQGFSFGDSSRSIISLGSIKRVEKFPSIQTNRVTESFKIRLGDLNSKTLVCSLGNSGLERLSH
jgi:hypothetical protein